MARSLLLRFLDHYDPVYYGATPEGVVNGIGMDCGIDFTRVAGGYNLYRSEGETPDTDNAIPVGATSATASPPTAIRNYVGYPFAASTVYRLWVRAIGKGGAEESYPTDTIRIEADGGGDPLDEVPNSPIRLSVSPRPDGKMLLTWSYDDRGEQTAVGQYKVYHDNGTGTMDWATPIGATKARAFLTGAYANGTTVAFGVRAESADGAQETNTTTASGVADATGPADIDAPTVAEGKET